MPPRKVENGGRGWPRGAGRWAARGRGSARGGRGRGGGGGGGGDSEAARAEAEAAALREAQTAVKRAAEAAAAAIAANRKPEPVVVHRARFIADTLSAAPIELLPELIALVVAYSDGGGCGERCVYFIDGASVLYVWNADQRLYRMCRPTFPVDDLTNHTRLIVVPPLPPSPSTVDGRTNRAPAASGGGGDFVGRHLFMYALGLFRPPFRLFREVSPCKFELISESPPCVTEQCAGTVRAVAHVPGTSRVIVAVRAGKHVGATTTTHRGDVEDSEQLLSFDVARGADACVDPLTIATQHPEWFAEAAYYSPSAVERHWTQLIRRGELARVYRSSGRSGARGDENGGVDAAVAAFETRMKERYPRLAASASASASASVSAAVAVAAPPPAVDMSRHTISRVEICALLPFPAPYQHWLLLVLDPDNESTQFEVFDTTTNSRVMRVFGAAAIASAAAAAAALGSKKPAATQSLWLRVTDGLYDELCWVNWNRLPDAHKLLNAKPKPALSAADDDRNSTSFDFPYSLMCRCRLTGTFGSVFAQSASPVASIHDWWSAATFARAHSRSATPSAGPRAYANDESGRLFYVEDRFDAPNDCAILAPYQKDAAAPGRLEFAVVETYLKTTRTAADSENVIQSVAWLRDTDYVAVAEQSRLRIWNIHPSARRGVGSPVTHEVLDRSDSHPPPNVSCAHAMTDRCVVALSRNRFLLLLLLLLLLFRD